MEELIPVNVLVGDRNYRVKIKPSDEENLRKTIKLVNGKLLDFKTNFAGKDMQDYIAMVLIWFATEQNSSAVTSADMEEISEKLKNLKQIIAAVL
jgi:hypothetical protein